MNTENRIGVNQNVVNFSGHSQTPEQSKSVREDVPAQDSFSHTAEEKPGNLSQSKINSILFSVEGIQKSKYDFKFKGHAQSPDGTLYSAYSDIYQEKGNYVSAVSPGGDVKWEANVGEDGLLDISAGSDGTLYAHTKNKLVAFEPGGNRKFQHEFEAKVYDNKVDSQGNIYFREGTEFNLYVLDKDGNRKELSPDLSEARPDRMKIVDGALWTREKCKTVETDDNSKTVKLSYDWKEFAPESIVIKRFDPVTGEKTAQYSFKEYKNDKNTIIRDFFPQADGELLVLGNEQERHVDNLFLKHDTHMFGGFGFGGIPHIPHNYEPTVITINHHYIKKVDEDNNELWTVQVPGQQPEVAVRNDGAVLYCSNEKDKDDNKFNVFRVDPNGDQKKIASLDYAITDFKVRPQDNHLFVRVETGSVFEFDGNDTEVRKSRPEDDKKLKMTDFTIDGKILMTDKENKGIYQWNPEDNKLVQITDHTRDHTLKTAVMEKLQEQEKQDETDKTVVVKDEYVTVGGVKLKKWNKGKEYK
jgi:hypothetical protein